MLKIFLLAVSVTFSISLIQVPVASAEEKGAALLEERCSVCHPSARPKSKQKTPGQWESTVSRMMGKGAKLTDAEKQVLIKYLSDNFKP